MLTMVKSAILSHMKFSVHLSVTIRNVSIYVLVCAHVHVYHEH